MTFWAGSQPPDGIILLHRHWRVWKVFERNVSIPPTTASTNQLDTCRALIHYIYMCEYIYSLHCSNNHTWNKHCSTIRLLRACFTQVLLHNTDGTSSAELYTVDSTATTYGYWGTRGAKLCSQKKICQSSSVRRQSRADQLESNMRLTTNRSGDNTAHI